MKKDPKYDWYLPDNDNTLSRILESDKFNSPGEHSSGERDLAIACCHNFETAMDIGGNVGMWARPLTKRFNKTIIFEPIKNHYECLLKNLRNVNPDKYDFYDKCLSDVNKTVVMESSNHNTGQSRVLDKINKLLPKKKKFGSWGGKKIEMEAVTLDSFLEHLHYTAIDFIKIDVEGHESKVLKGAVKTISRYKPVIMLECFGTNRCSGGAQAEKLIMDVLNQNDFWSIPNRKTMRSQISSSIMGEDFQASMVPPEDYFKKQINFIFCHDSMYQETLNKYIRFWNQLK